MLARFPRETAADGLLPTGCYRLLDESALDDVLPAAAIAFPHTHPSIINVTLGMRSAEQVGRNVELHDQRVPDGLCDDLRTQGLIRSDVLAGHGGGRDARCL